MAYLEHCCYKPENKLLSIGIAADFRQYSGGVSINYIERTCTEIEQIDSVKSTCLMSLSQ